MVQKKIFQEVSGLYEFIAEIAEKPIKTSGKNRYGQGIVLNLVKVNKNTFGRVIRNNAKKIRSGWTNQTRPPDVVRIKSIQEKFSLIVLDNKPNLYSFDFQFKCCKPTLIADLMVDTSDRTIFR